MKQKIKRILITFLSLTILLISLLPAFAVNGSEGIDKQMEQGWENGEERIDVRVDLDKNGTAHIKEYWAVNVDNDWSEIYIPMTHMNGMEIENLKVKNKSTGDIYKMVDGSWDTYSHISSTEEKRELKKNKCGLHSIDEGKEICWGVSNSGYNVYELDYSLTKAVKAYSDSKDGFHIRFVNSEMNIDNLSAVTVIIGMADGEKLTKNNTKIWAFGLEGDIQLQNGNIVCRSKSDGVINFCNIMAEFDTSLFDDGIAKTDLSFEDVQKKAFEGSDYSIGEDEKKPSPIRKFFSFLLENILFVIIFIVILLKELFGRRIQGSGNSDLINVDSIKKSEKNHKDYARDIPMHGSKAAAVTTLTSLNNIEPTNENILSAYILSFLQKGVVKSQKGNGKKDSYLIVEDGKEDILESDSEKALYRILLSAADVEGKLDSKRMKSYGNKNAERMKSWYKNIKREGKRDIISYGYTDHIEVKKGFKKEMVDAFNEEGKKEALKYKGLENFFRDFTIINEREMSDVGLWKDYLVYASIFGLTKKVAREMNKLLPDYFENPEKYGYSPYAYSGGYTFFDYYMINRFASSLNSGITAQEQAARSSGGGGVTSLGGGGGFSGGGSGGGGR